MNKIVIGIILGAVLGFFDGLTSWLTPEVRKDIIGIIIGSTFKGVVAGVAAGIFARKVKSTVAGVLFGLFVGLALAYWVAAMQGKYYFEIMLPGGTVGAILGWATQRYGKPARSATAAMTAMALLLTASVHAHEEQRCIGGVTIPVTDDAKAMERWSPAADGPKLDPYLNSRGDAKSSQ